MLSKYIYCIASYYLAAPSVKGVDNFLLLVKVLAEKQWSINKCSPNYRLVSILILDMKVLMKYCELTTKLDNKVSTSWYFLSEAVSAILSPSINSCPGDWKHTLEYHRVRLWLMLQTIPPTERPPLAASW